jgi:hypothetical protein
LYEAVIIINLTISTLSFSNHGQKRRSYKNRN